MIRFLVALSVVLVGCQKSPFRVRLLEPTKVPTPKVEVPSVVVTEPKKDPVPVVPGTGKPAGTGVAGAAKPLGDEEAAAAVSKPTLSGFLKPIVCRGETIRVDRVIQSGEFKSVRVEGCVGENAKGHLVPTQRWAVYHSNGLLRAVQEYDLGVRTGHWRSWDLAGLPESTVTYRNGELHGALTGHGSKFYQGRNVNEVEAEFRKGNLVAMDSYRWSRVTVTTVPGGRRIEAYSFDTSKRPFAYLVADSAKVTFENGTLENFLSSIYPTELARFVLNSRFLTRYSRTDRGEVQFYLSGGKTVEAFDRDAYGFRFVGEKILSDLYDGKEKIDFDREHYAHWVRANPVSIIYEWLRWTATSLEKSALEKFVPVEDLTR